MDGGESAGGRARPKLVLICLTLFVLILPLTLSKPGIPTVLKADEAAYYLAALSFWQDGDLVVENADARRLFREYPGSKNLKVMSRGQGQPVYFGVTFPYPLLASPFVGLLGANGMVFLNAALLMAMVWMGVAYLRRYNAEPLATLFSCGFFLLSTAFVYLFWLQPEVFNMARVMGALFLAERAVNTPAPPGGRLSPATRLTLHLAGSALLLTTVSYSKPMLAVLALPILYLLIRERSWRGLATFGATAALTAVVLTGAAFAMTQQVWPYFAPRTGVNLASPIDFIEREVAPKLPKKSPVVPVRRLKRESRQFRVSVATELRDAASEFFVGRHGGILIYMPFAVVALIFFLLRDRRSPFRWLILGSAILAGALFVTLVRGHWLGGGGFVGNRYFSAVYPSFLFLVTAIRPAWLTAVGYGAAAVFLGPLLLTPMGAPVVEPTLQAHVRNQPYPRLPMEWSLVRTLTGYRNIQRDDLTFHGRSDEIVGREDEIWVRGAKKVEISILSSERQRGFVFELRNQALNNTTEVCLGEECRQLVFSDVPPVGTKRRIDFESARGEPLPRAGRDAEAYRYRLTVESLWGEQPRWRGSGREKFYLGAAIAYLGSPEDLGLDMVAVEWLRVDAPESMPAGATVPLPVALRNASPNSWPNTGTARVRLGYHWLTEDGESVSRGGRRTELPEAVEPGSRAETDMLIETPETGGRYLLELDLVRERIYWFSSRDEAVAHRLAVEVVDPQAP